MNKDYLMALAQDATNDAELSSRDIPAIDLYVDQIINLISGKLEEGSERHRSRVLTKTMVNNYSKDGIITPVKGKKYTREQVTQILCVYSLKNTLSIGEIKRLLDGAYGIEGFGARELTALYDRHQSIKDRTREYASTLLSEGILEALELDPSDDVDYIATVCALVSMSAHLKNIAQAMIDEKFPEPVEDEESEKEKDKEKDKQKDKEKKAKEKEKDKQKDKEKPKKKKEVQDAQAE
jgi:hypothetical protein